MKQHTVVYLVSRTLPRGNEKCFAGTAVVGIEMPILKSFHVFIL